AEDGIRDFHVTGVQTCALPIWPAPQSALGRSLRFGRVVGALTVLDANKVLDEDTGLATLAAAGGTGPRFERMWSRFTGRPVKDRSEERRVGKERRTAR